MVAVIRVQHSFDDPAPTSTAAGFLEEMIIEQALDSIQALRAITL